MIEVAVPVLTRHSGLQPKLGFRRAYVIKVLRIVAGRNSARDPCLFCAKNCPQAASFNLYSSPGWTNDYIRFTDGETEAQICLETLRKP